MARRRRRDYERLVQRPTSTAPRLRPCQGEGSLPTIGESSLKPRTLGWLLRDDSDGPPQHKPGIGKVPSCARVFENLTNKRRIESQPTESF